MAIRRGRVAQRLYGLAAIPRELKFKRNSAFWRIIRNLPLKLFYSQFTIWVSACAAAAAAASAPDTAKWDDLLVSGRTMRCTNGIVWGTVLCDRGKCNLVEVAHDACILHAAASFSMRNEAKNTDHYYKILKGFSWLCFKLNSFVLHSAGCKWNFICFLESLCHYCSHLKNTWFWVSLLRHFIFHLPDDCQCPKSETHPLRLRYKCFH